MLHGWMGKFELSFDFLFCCLCSLSHSHSLSFAISGARMWISHFRVQTLCYATASLAAEKQLISVHLNRLKFGGIGAAMVKARFLHKVKPTSITTAKPYAFSGTIFCRFIEAALHSNPYALLMILVTIYSLCHFASTTIFNFHTTHSIHRSYKWHCRTQTNISLQIEWQNISTNFPGFSTALRMRIRNLK